MTHPCSTLEQRWSACRAPVYAVFESWIRMQKCALFGGACWGLVLLVGLHRRRCTSPRRHQCRSGGVRSWCWTHYAGHQERCQHLPDDPFDDPQVARWLADA